MVNIVPFIAAVLALMIAMAAAWAVYRRTKNAGWIDAIWTFGTGFAGAAAALAPIAAAPTPRQWIVAALTALWSIRLGLHITHRNRHRPDDPRYANMLADWGADAYRNLFLLLQKQAWCGSVLVATIFIAARRPGDSLLASDLIGGALVLVALAGEAIADNQLRVFVSDPANRGRVCDIGLWGLSRHPNYFFEWLAWLAYPIIAIDLGGGYPWGWMTLAGPAMMYALLVYVSGIPPLEAHMMQSRGDAFERYRARTNAFFPWIRRGA